MKNLFVFIASFSLLISCSESIDVDQGNRTSDEQTILNNTLSIKEWDEVSRLMQMNDTERIEFEKLNNFVSFATKSKEVYESFDFENAKSVEEIKAFVEDHSEYVELVDDENGELSFLPKYHMQPESYVMNRNKEFYVGTTKYNVEGKDVVSTSSLPTTLASLLGEDDEVLVSGKINEEVRSTAATCPNITYLDFYQTRSPYRVNGYYSISRVNDYTVKHKVSFSFQQRILGIWGASKKAFFYYSFFGEIVPANGTVTNHLQNKFAFEGDGEEKSHYYEKNQPTATLIRDGEWRVRNYHFSFMCLPFGVFSAIANGDSFMEKFENCEEGAGIPRLTKGERSFLIIDFIKETNDNKTIVCIPLGDIKTFYPSYSGGILSTSRDQFVTIDSGPYKGTHRVWYIYTNPSWGLQRVHLYLDTPWKGN